MIPDIGIQELLIIGALALIVVGPKDLPLMLRKLGRMVGQAKKLAREFQSSFDELGRQAELEELKKEVEALKKDATGDIDKEFAKTNRELGEAMRDKPSGAKSGQQNVRTEPQQQSGQPQSGETPPGESKAPGIEPPPGAGQSEGAPARPAGPRIEPAAEAKPRPRPQTPDSDAAGDPGEPAKQD